MTTFPDVMVDIETTGTNPESNAMIQLAAVRFNYDTGEVDCGESDSFFNRCLHIPHGRYFDEDCRENFWLRDKKDLLKRIYARQENPKIVMDAFFQWGLAKAPDSTPMRFWAKPTHFDYSFFQSYEKQFDLPNLFHYRSARDVNSFISGLAGDPTYQPIEKELEFTGEQHNAIHDVLHQIKVLLAAKERWGKK